MAKPKSDKKKQSKFGPNMERRMEDKEESNKKHGDEPEDEPKGEPKGELSGQKVLELPINDILDNPNQPRKRFDEESLRELADSIEANELLNPVLVRKGEDGYYLVAGERRLRACKSLGRDTIKAIEVGGDPEIASLIDNLQREDLHPVERALAVKKLHEKYNKNTSKVAKAISKSESMVQRLITLCELPEKIIATDDEDTTQRLTNNKIPLREFFELMRINEKDALNAKLKQLEQKYSQEPNEKPIQRRATVSKDEMDKYLSVAEKMLNLITKAPPRREDQRLVRLKEELENILRKIEDILQDEFASN